MPRYYPAIVEKEKESDYGVSFPDFPGCVGAGESVEDAVRDAERALALHITGMVRDGERLPVPSHVEDLVRDPEVEQVAVVMVPARVVGAPKRISVSIDENLLAEIDATAKSLGVTRSRFLADAAREKVETT